MQVASSTALLLAGRLLDWTGLAGLLTLADGDMRLSLSA